MEPHFRFLTCFCNQVHNLENGFPIGHECYILKPEILQKEAAGEPIDVKQLPTDRILCPKGVKYEKETTTGRSEKTRK